MALRQCCCCVPLRTGALTVAILYLVVNVGVLMGFSAWFIADLVNYMSNENAENGRPQSWKFMGYLLLMLSGLCGLNITMDSLLVHGIRRNRRKFMLPWVVWYGIFTSMVTLTLLGVWMWLLVRYIEEAKHPYDDNGTLVPILSTIGGVAALSLPVMWFWYACVVSYYSVLAPSDVYVMESLREPDTDGALLSYRPAKKDAA